MALFEEKVAFDEEYRIRRKDGTWIWVHDRATRTHEDDGVLCADGFMSDITQRKQAEAELRSKTAFLEAQANSTIDGLLVVDNNGRRLIANERFMELLCIPLELMSEVDDRRMLDYVVSLIGNPESFRAKVEYLYRHPSETSHLAMRNRNFSPKFFEALVTLDPNAEESEIRKCRIEELIPGMILQEEVRSTTGGLLVSRGQEITPTVIFKLRNFHSRHTIAGEITVAMPTTTLSFVKGATQGKS